MGKPSEPVIACVRQHMVELFEVSWGHTAGTKNNIHLNGVII